MFGQVSQCSGEDFQFLNQLNDSQLLDHFDKSSFDNLMVWADENQRFRELILNHTAVSKFRFNKRPILILPSIFHVTTPIDFTNKVINIHGEASALKFLRVFGSIIPGIATKNLKIKMNLCILKSTNISISIALIH